MGYSIGTGKNGRDIGYGVPAICDQPGCNEKIDRGMSYCCGGSPWNDEGCHLYFCGKHLGLAKHMGAHEDDNDAWCGNLCDVCRINWALGDDNYKLWAAEYDPKPDTLQWMLWKQYHESWETWRTENPDDFEAMKKEIAKHSKLEIKREVRKLFAEMEVEDAV